MINWQPIETAPPDKDVLIFIEGAIIQAKYCQATAYNGTIYPYKWEVASLPSHGCGCCYEDNEEPTHWAEINLP